MIAWARQEHRDGHDAAALAPTQQACTGVRPAILKAEHSLIATAPMCIDQGGDPPEIVPSSTPHPPNYSQRYWLQGATGEFSAWLSPAWRSSRRE